MPLYVITARAGKYVGGRPNTGVGTVLELTASEAQYEVTLGTLRPMSLAPDVEADVTPAPFPSFWQTTWNGARFAGKWMSAPSIFRLRLIGTGTVLVDSKNRLGVVTSAVEFYTASNATNQIEFPALGRDAVEMRLTYPASLLVEVLA